MKWILPLLIWVAAPVSHAGLPSPTGNTTHIAVAWGAPDTVAAIIGERIWVSLNGGASWYISGRIAPDDLSVTDTNEATSTALSTFSPSSEESENADSAFSDNSDVAVDTLSADGATVSDLMDATDAAADTSPLLLAVTDTADVVFWQQSTGRVSVCPIASACTVLAHFNVVRGLAVDKDGTLWIGTNDIIYGYRQYENRRNQPVVSARLTGLTSLLRRHTDGRVMALGNSGLYQLSGEATPVLTQAYPTLRARIATFAGNRLITYCQGGLFTPDDTGRLQLQKRIAGPVHRMAATSKAIWVRRSANWFVTTLPFQSTDSHAPWRVLPGVHDVAINRISIWLATTQGPVRRPANDNSVRTTMPDSAVDTCMRSLPHQPNGGLIRTMPTVPSIHSPWRLLLPRVRLMAGVYRGTESSTVWPHMFDTATHTAVQAGILLQWQRRHSSADAIRMLAQFNRMNARWQMKRQSQLSRVWQRYPALCTGLATENDPVRQAILRLEIEKLKRWLSLGNP